MSYTPTYRYAVGIVGANYAQPDQMEPRDWIMVQSHADARRVILNAAMNQNWRGDESGAGEHILDTPGYGNPGDYALIYRVNREHPDFSEVLDEPGDRARHAFGYVDFEYPARILSFGPRGGLRIE